MSRFVEGRLLAPGSAGGLRCRRCLLGVRPPAEPGAACITSFGTPLLLRCLLVSAALLLTGCPREAPQPAAAPRASVTLRVLVVNEPQLAEAVNHLRGEWTERTGGELNVQAAAWKDVDLAKPIDADLIVFPSRYLGELASRELLRPVRNNVLDDETLNTADIFPIVRNELIKWGGQTMALPLGIAPSAIDPAANAPKSIELLAVAAPRAITNEHIGVLFDTESMKPRINEKPFEEALGDIVQTPIPTREGQGEGLTTASSPEAAVIPILGYDDRLIAVTASSHNAASAFKLLSWLAQADISSQLAKTAGGKLPPRRSRASSAAWYDSSLSATDRAERGKQLETSLGGVQALVIPRIPAVDEYLATLDDAVKAATTDKVSPGSALQTAADRWEKITDVQGRDKQRTAYHKHLGISSE